jgi:hypothetical protein
MAPWSDIIHKGNPIKAPIVQGDRKERKEALIFNANHPNP